MRGIVKWFNTKRGYGWIVDDNNEVFVHQTQIKMNGFRSLHEGDIVSYELGWNDFHGQMQAINVSPIITLPLIKSALREKGLYCKSKKWQYDSTHRYDVWFVTYENGILLTSEEGLSLYELAEYAGFNVDEELDKAFGHSSN